jgi:hypothetical protein
MYFGGMNIKRTLVVTALLLPALFSHGQITVSGLITDSESKEPVPYVNIGIRNKNKGTCSLADGSFKLQLPSTCSNDSLTFSMIGYTEQSISLKTYTSGEPLKIVLSKKPYELVEATIAAKKLQEKKYGIKKYNPVLHFIDGIPNYTDIFEIAQLVHLEKSYSKVTSLHLYINETLEDSGIFRINFYNYDGTMPTSRCVEKEIRQTKKKKEGWLSFDLSKEQIYLKGNVVAAIEFIPGKTKIEYEVKLGGRTRSFFRQHSLGEWQQPPHHYRLYITALTDADKNEEAESEEDEAPPTLRLFSKAVQDSFSLFVKLPSGYNKEAKIRYPVVYLTDANAYFDLLSDEYKSKQFILVGIGYRNAFEADSLRERDYTWPKTSIPGHRFTSGGADRFYTFFREELLPYIDANYCTDTATRTLMGHSLGGYFTLYALKKDMEASVPLFSHYVSASPSLDYANGYLLKAFGTAQEKNSRKQQLYMSIGGKEEEGNDFKLFAELLESDRFKNLELKTAVFEKADHMGAALPAFKKALKD